MNRHTAILTLILLTWGFSANAAETGNPTDSFQSHQSILDAVQQYLLGNPENQQYSETSVEVGRIDSRLQLQQCDKPLETYLAPGSRLTGKTTIGVRCASPKPWALYVPATVTTFAMVYQTVRPLPRNHIITAQDLVAAKTELGRLNRGYYTNINDLIGKQTRRSLLQGQALNPGLIKAPQLVKRGGQVALVAGNPQFSIRTMGQALSDGAEGDQIRVKNLSSNRIVEGTVTGQGIVTVMD